MTEFDWDNIHSRLLSIENIENKVNADKLFVSLIMAVEKRRISIQKEFTISEISELIPIGTAGINNYATYGFSIMSMMGGQKHRDYFVFSNTALRDEFTALCNNNRDRDNYYWSKNYPDEKLRINPKYLKV